MRFFARLALFSLLVALSAGDAAAQAPEPPEPQELRLKNGQRVTIAWEHFDVLQVALYMHGSQACVNGERLAGLPREVRQIVQWGAEENGVEGDVEEFLRRSISLPVGKRIVAKTPFVFDIPYATGMKVGTRQSIIVPVCGVERDDQQLVFSAASKMRAYREYVYREQQKVQAAQEAAVAAWTQAVIMRNYARYTLEVLRQMQGY